ncbi:MAG: hypothetical protein EBX02_10195 [Betaproteobacteria bacterium]|nr:hypothetical protein [Betaproteobacteria bacterium]
MRITLEDPSLFAEISANKYLLSIRLLKCDRDQKPTLINAVIDEKAGTESGRLTNLNPQSSAKKP